MNCVNCGQSLPECEKFDIPSDWQPTEKQHIDFSKIQLKFSAEPLQLGVQCPVCENNAIAVKDLMKRGALAGEKYVTMQLERKIVEHVSGDGSCGCDQDSYCNGLRKLLGWKLK